MSICRVCAAPDCKVWCTGCNIVAYCSQQCARNNVRDHASVCADMAELHANVLDALEPKMGDPTIIGEAFRGDIKSMAALLELVPREFKPNMKKAILQLFPKEDEAEVRRALLVRVLPQAVQRLQSLFDWKYQ